MKMYTAIDWGPDTPEEQEAKARLAALHRRYREAAEPFLKVLADAQARKIPRITIIG
jgi:hypothetical protein